MAEDKEFPQGHVLFKQGTKGGELFFIKEGSVDLVVRNPETGEDRRVAQAKERSVLGTMTFLEGEPRSATAICTTPVKCSIVDQIQREKLLAQVPPWFKVLLKDLSGNLRRLNEEFVALSVKHEILEKRFKILKAKAAKDDPKAAADKGEAKNADAKKAPADEPGDKVEEKK